MCTHAHFSAQLRLTAAGLAVVKVCDDCHRYARRLPRLTNLARAEYPNYAPRFKP